jgi:hypothetical protein
MEDFTDWNFAGGRFSRFELRRNNRTMQNGTLPWRSYMTIGDASTIRTMLQMARKHIYGRIDRIWDVETATQ